MEQQHLKQHYIQEQQALHRAAVVYGSGLAMQLNIERNIVGTPQHSYIHLEVAMNKLNDIGGPQFLASKKFEEEQVQSFQQSHYI